jgi:hypothetical protein
MIVRDNILISHNDVLSCFFFFWFLTRVAMFWKFGLVVMTVYGADRASGNFR